MAHRTRAASTSAKGSGFQHFVLVIDGPPKVARHPVDLHVEPEALVRWISEPDGVNAAIGLKAGPLSQWLHREFSEAGQPIVLMETRQVKGALKVMPIQTDRRNAEGIARLLHFG